MKYLNYLEQISALFRFKSITDEHQNEYILFENSALDTVRGIKDKTAFAAVENHVHIVENIKKNEFEKLALIGSSLGKAVLCSLKNRYPDKHFMVYVSLLLHDSMIIRFHQKWENEQAYYDPAHFSGEDERVILFED